MGGLGSGRSSGFGRGKVKGRAAIDANFYHRNGYLRPGYKGRWRFRSGGKNMGAIQLSAEEKFLGVEYQFRNSAGEWVNGEETIGIVRVPCRFGGTRPYFVCTSSLNGVSCHRRVTKMYLSGRRFLCRRCCQLTYASQCESYLWRLRRRAWKSARRIGGDGLNGPIVPRPKGMWRRTHKQLLDEAIKWECRAEDEFELQGKKLMDRIDKKERRKS